MVLQDEPSGQGPVKRRLTGREVLLGGMLAVALLAFGAWRAWPGDLPSPLALLQQLEIQQQTAQLIGTPRTAELPIDRAARARAAIKAGDYVAAEKLVADELAQSRLTAWKFSPFSAFVDEINVVNDDAFAARLDDWVESHPKDPLPLIVRADYLFKMACDICSGKLGAMINRAPREVYYEKVDKAAADITHAIALRDDIPYSYWLWLRIVGDKTENSATTDFAFQTGIAKFPEFYQLYRWRLVDAAFDPGRLGAGDVCVRRSLCRQGSGRFADADAVCRAVSRSAVHRGL
jgi:hypothetical protein